MQPADLGLPAHRFPDFRRYPGFDQLQVAQDLAAGTKRFEVFNAATGSGKSATAATVAALMSRAARQADPDRPFFRWLVLVGTKGLQHQYLADELVKASVVGHRNYPCMPDWSARNATAEEADDPEFRCLAVPRDRCGYMIDTTAARASTAVVGNYAYWLSLGRYSDPGLLGEFDFLVLDEAHDAPHWLTRAMQVSLTPFRISAVLGRRDYYRMGKGEKIEQWEEWLSELFERVGERVEQLDPVADRKEHKRAARLFQELKLVERAASPERRKGYGMTEPWVVIPHERGEGVTFSPRWGLDFAEQYLFRSIPRVLLMSATVTPEHARQLGIAESDANYREVPSPFDVRRRPLIWVPTARVDFRMSDGTRFKLVQRVDQVIGAAIEQQAGNVMIHSVTYEWATEIKQRSQWGPAIITHPRDSVRYQAALEDFKAAGRAGRFAVMVSPRMVEGVDLPDECCRVLIVIKCPFPYTLDPLEKTRCEDPKYRDLVVAQKITQMVGRPVRGVGDWATTVILDNHWVHVAKDCPFAGWLRAAFRTVREGDDGVLRLELLTQERVDRLPPLTGTMFLGGRLDAGTIQLVQLILP